MLRRSFLAAVLPGPATRNRIVSTVPNATEILFALGFGDRLVGVSSFCRYPPAARILPKVGSFAAPDLERIVSLKPDLAVVQKLPSDIRGKLAGMGMRVVEVKHGSVKETLASIEQIAEACGSRQRGIDLAAGIRRELAGIEARIAGRPRRTMTFIVGRNSGSASGLIAVGPGSYLDDLIAIAGGRNVFADAIAAYPKVSVESLIARNPDVIVDMGDMAPEGGLTARQRDEIAALWMKYPMIGAVRSKRVFAVSNDIFVVPGPRMVEAAREFARMLHPEAMR
jgi:iron complex transport system substrate-binding protein